MVRSAQRKRRTARPPEQLREGFVPEQVFEKREAIDERLASVLPKAERVELGFDDQLAFWDTHLREAEKVKADE